MLESMYISLFAASLVCLILSVCIGNKESRKLLSKAFLSSIAMVLFGALALASTDIQVAYCSTSSCSVQSFFYEDLAYIMWSLSFLSAAITVVHAVMTIIYLVKGGVEMSKEEGTQI